MNFEAQHIFACYIGTQDNASKYLLKKEAKRYSETLYNALKDLDKNDYTTRAKMNIWKQMGEIPFEYCNMEEAIL